MQDHIVTKGWQEQVAEARFGADVPTLLDVLYTREGLSQQAVADRLGVHRSTVVRWMREYRVPTRDRRAIVAALEEVA